MVAVDLVKTFDLFLMLLSKTLLLKICSKEWGGIIIIIIITRIELNWIIIIVDRANVVGLATRYGLDGPGIASL